MKSDISSRRAKSSEQIWFQSKLLMQTSFLDPVRRNDQEINKASSMSMLLISSWLNFCVSETCNYFFRIHLSVVRLLVLWTFYWYKKNLVLPYYCSLLKKYLFVRNFVDLGAFYCCWWLEIFIEVLIKFFRFETTKCNAVLVCQKRMTDEWTSLSIWNENVFWPGGFLKTAK